MLQPLGVYTDLWDQYCEPEDKGEVADIMAHMRPGLDSQSQRHDLDPSRSKMPLGQFANQTQTNCTAPLLDEALFSRAGGYTAGRYCGLGSFEDGTTCCFPCPIQDWLYPTQWQEHLRIPNYLSILSVTLCLFLLLSFAVLPPETTHRHYLSVGLLFPVLFISLSFAIPVTTNPSMCYDAITPHDMKSSMSCAWTGSLVTLGGIGSVVWVFLRSLWLHIRIFWDRDPGKRFMWGSIIAGTVLPLVFLIAMLSVTGFSYRMGQTCLPNQENAIVTFWIWLVIFAILAFILQFVTTGYCFYVYVRSLRKARRESGLGSFERGRARQKMETWANVKKLFLLQWRNILVTVFVIIGSISFFIVFWTQDEKLGRVFNDESNIVPVKTWIICQTLSMGDKEECRRYVKDFTVDQAAVLVSLILASLVGISIFILLFRTTMFRAWLALFRRVSHRALHRGRPPTPELTSLENADKYQASHTLRKGASLTSSDAQSAFSSPTDRSLGTTIDRKDLGTGLGELEKRPTFERVTSETGLITPPGVTRLNKGVWEEDSSRAETPEQRQRPSTRLSQIQPSSPHVSSYTPSREAPSPPPRTSSSAPSKARPAERFSTAPTVVNRGSVLSGLSIQRTTSSKVRGRISAPVPASFVHVNGAFIDAKGEGMGRRDGGGA